MGGDFVTLPCGVDEPLHTIWCRPSTPTEFGGYLQKLMLEGDVASPFMIQLLQEQIDL